MVDNGSGDQTIRLINEKYPSIKVIQSENVGYGAGNNKVIKKIESKYHFILNPDISFDNNLISEIVKYMEINPTCVMCLPGIYSPEGKLKHPPQRNPKLRYLIARWLPSRRKFVRKYNAEYTNSDSMVNAACDIEVCSGSFMACRTEALKAVDGFDERYFLYFEDFDLSRKMNQIGKVQYLPQLQAVHVGKREARTSFKAKRIMLKSMVQYFNKWGWRI